MKVRLIRKSVCNCLNSLYEYHGSKYIWLPAFRTLTVTETKMCDGGGDTKQAPCEKVYKKKKRNGCRSVWDWCWGLVWLPRPLL